MKLIKYFIPFLAVLVLMALFPMEAMANPGLQINNMILVTDVSPGETLTYTMTISIGATDPATGIAVQVEGLTQAPDGTNGPLAPAEDTGPYSARSFISIDKNSFQLEPGASQDVTATINIPQNVGAGGRYAMIHFATQSTPGAEVNILSAIDVPIVLTITNSQLTQTGKITALTIGQPVNGQPLDISTTFQNTGNHHYKVQGDVTVSNSKGAVLQNIVMPLTGSSIVPNMSMQFKTAFTPQGNLPSGIYSVNSKIMLADGTVLDKANGRFTIGSVQSPIKWLVIGVVLGVVIVIGLIIFLVVRRKHK
jgi:hypothetical protein